MRGLLWGSGTHCTAPIRGGGYDGSKVSYADDWRGGSINAHHGLGVDVGAAMSHYCGEHPRYEAKREPQSSCRLCWKLYLYKNPEAKADLQRTYQEAEALKADL